MSLKVTIADPSYIIRSGMSATLSEFDDLDIKLFEISDIMELKNAICWQKPDILIVNPASLGFLSLRQIKRECDGENVKMVALTSTVIDEQTLNEFNEVVSIYDSAQQIKEKLEKLINEPKEDKRREELSPREKEVVSYVVEGMTNKEIADAMSLSIHTVITHRRNISAKLDINSVAGLTIYAIVNKLVDLDEVKE